MSKLLENAAEQLHSRGGRMTAQRQHILQALNCLGGHPTAEQIFELASKYDPGLNLSTVYRTLRWLEQAGFISARRFDDTGRHVHFDPAQPAEHFHFVCKGCERVIEFDDPSIESIRRQFERTHSVEVTSISLMFYGICKDCQSRP